MLYHAVLVFFLGAMATSMSSTYLSESSEGFAGCESSNELELSTDESDATLSPQAVSDSEIDSELEDLYESFDYEDEAEAALSQASEDVTTHGIPARMIPSLDGRILSTPIFPSAVLTMFESYLLIFQYAIRHGLTTKAFTELLQLLSVHVPQGAALPKSVYLLKRLFVKAFPECTSVPHWYCSFCQRSLPACDATCTGRGCSSGPPAVFITIPLGPQIR